MTAAEVAELLHMPTSTVVLLLQHRNKPFKRFSSLPKQVLFVAALPLFDVSGLVEVTERFRVSKRLDVHVLDADIGHCLPKCALCVSPTARDGQLANVDQSLNSAARIWRANAMWSLWSSYPTEPSHKPVVALALRGAEMSTSSSRASTWSMLNASSNSAIVNSATVRVSVLDVAVAMGRSCQILRAAPDL